MYEYTILKDQSFGISVRLEGAIIGNLINQKHSDTILNIQRPNPGEEHITIINHPHTKSSYNSWVLQITEIIYLYQYTSMNSYTKVE